MIEPPPRSDVRTERLALGLELPHPALELAGHGVELRPQRGELVVALRRDLRVQVTPAEPPRRLQQPRDLRLQGPGHGRREQEREKHEGDEQQDDGAAVVAGLAITASASFAHDIYTSVIKKGNSDPRKELKVAKTTVVVIGLVSIAGGIGAQGQNVAFLVALAFAVAASANLPTILYSLFWKRFTTQGALWSMYGGLASALLLIIFSPVMSGTETSMIPGVDFAIFPLKNPGIISIPLAFFLGWVGSILDKRVEDPQKQAEMEVRSLTGVGAEKAVDH